MQRRQVRKPSDLSGQERERSPPLARPAMVNWDFGVPHFAAKIECDCLGCRSERQLESKTGEETATGPRLPPLPPLAENAILEPGEIVERDKPVLTMFAGSYLAPLLPMTRSTTWEIRRGAITSLARLSDDHLRAAVAALRSFKGRSVLVDIMEYCSSQLVDAVARREAVEGLVNLLGHTHAQSELRAEGLLPDLLILLRYVETDSGMKLRFPMFIRGIEGLCRNRKLAMLMVRVGFGPDLLRVASDLSGGAGLIAAGVRSAAVNALISMSQNPEARVQLKNEGALVLATDLLRSELHELRRSGGTLACNLCLHTDNRLDALRSPLLEQMIISASTPKPGEDADLALALASLVADVQLVRSLSSPAMCNALLALLRHGSREGCRHAAWASSNLASSRPVAPSMLQPEFLDVLLCLCEDNTASAAALLGGRRTDKQCKRDAKKTLCWLAPLALRELQSGLAVRRRLVKLIVRCAESTDPEIQSSGLLVLGVWSETLALHDELVKHGMLLPLTLAISAPTRHAEHSPVAHLRGARALACLTVHQHYHRNLSEDGVVAPLLQLLCSCNQMVRVYAGRAVLNLSRNVHAALELVRQGGLATLLIIRRGDDPSFSKARLALDPDGALQPQRTAALMLARKEAAEAEAAAEAATTSATAKTDAAVAAAIAAVRPADAEEAAAAARRSAELSTLERE